MVYSGSSLLSSIASAYLACNRMDDVASQGRASNGVPPEFHLALILAQWHNIFRVHTQRQDGIDFLPSAGRAMFAPAAMTSGSGYEDSSPTTLGFLVVFVPKEEPWWCLLTRATSASDPLSHQPKTSPKNTKSHQL